MRWPWAVFVAVAVALGGCGSKEGPPGNKGELGGAAGRGRLGGGGLQAGRAQLPPASPLVRQAESAAESGDLDQAIALAEQAVSAAPQDARALYLLAYVAQSRAFELANSDRQAASPLFLKCAAAMRKLRDVKADLSGEEMLLLSNALYNEACVLALQNQPPGALDALREAFAAGFDNFALVGTDEDLEALRPLPEFQTLLSQARDDFKKRCREESRQELAQHPPFEFSFSLPDLAGNTVSSSDYKGKVLIVDFWGTWCPPCRLEIPHFVELRNNYREAGLEVVGINYEQLPPAEWKPAIDKVATELGITYPCLIGDRGTQAKIPNLEVFPTTLFIDRTGTVRLKLSGYHPYEKLESVVLLLLEEKT